MSTLSLLLIVWGAVVAAFVCLMIYRGNLTQHETDQLFLSDNTLESVHEENDAIIRRINKIQPICKGLGGAVALLTLAVIGTYVINVLPDVKLH
jgi:hypothetical protein